MEQHRHQVGENAICVADSLSSLQTLGAFDGTLVLLSETRSNLDLNL